jgi:hypothetical protein
MTLNAFTTKTRKRIQSIRLINDLYQQEELFHENRFLEIDIKRLEAEKLEDQKRIQHMEAQLGILRQQIAGADYHMFDSSVTEPLEIKVSAEELIRPLLTKVDELEGVFYMLPSDNKTFHNMNTRDYIRALEAFVAITRQYISVEVNGFKLPMVLHESYKRMVEIGNTPEESVLVPNPLVPGAFLQSRNLYAEYQGAIGDFVTLAGAVYGDPTKLQPKKRRSVEAHSPQRQPLF